MHYLLSTDWHLHGLVVPGWRVNGSTEFLVTLFIVAVVVLVQSAVKAAEHAVRTTFNVKSRCRKLLLHTFGTLLLAVDVFLGYVLMLSVMSGNVWVLLTVVGSSSLGYALFWWVAVPLGPRLRRRPRPGRSGSGTAAQNGGDGGSDRAGAAAAAAAATAGGGQTVLLAEARPLVEVPATPARDLANGAAPAMANGKSHAFSTFSAAPAAAAAAPHAHERAHQAAETEALLINGLRWQSTPAAAAPATATTFAPDDNGSPGMPYLGGWQPTQPQPDVVYGGGWRDSGGDLYNKYPVLTKYRKLDFEQDGAKENLELSELDSALQELTSFQQLQA